MSKIMMRNPIIHISKKVDAVHVFNNEVITIWLHNLYRGDGISGIQIELRVLKDGTREIFLDDDVAQKAKVRPFSEWYNPNIAEAPDGAEEKGEQNGK